MESKVSMRELAAMMALAGGKGRELCEDFVEAFFQTVAEELEAGRAVRIRDFGTFKLTGVEARKSVNVATGEEFEIAAHKKVVFVPGKELAAAVNSPFAMFEALEVADGISTEELTEKEETVAESMWPDEAEPMATEPEESATDAQAAGETACAEPVGEDPVAVETEEAPLPVYDSEEPEKRRTGRFIWGFLAGVALCAGVAAGLWWFGLVPIAEREVELTERIAGSLEKMEERPADPLVDSLAASEPRGVSEAAPAVATVPSDEVVRDTITRTRYLTTMARDHYGNFNLWPVIYEENKSFLGHPDRIKPGTAVVVPPLSKYGVNARNPEDVKRVKRQGAEIYSRYK